MNTIELASWLCDTIFILDIGLSLLTSFTLLLALGNIAHLGFGADEDISVSIAMVLVTVAYRMLTAKAQVSWDRGRAVLIAFIIVYSMALLLAWAIKHDATPEDESIMPENKE